MAKSIKVNQKKRGRPATGRDPVSAVRLPVELTAAVDQWAQENEANRSEAIRRLVELGLRAKAESVPDHVRAAADRAAARSKASRNR
jgi:metal-responsive CopG/Arc/MetJ family transcriptional regulator